MKIRSDFAALTIAAFLAAAAPMDAHHGFDVCRPGTPIAVTGKVVTLRWQNPHTALAVEVKDHKGAVTLWSFELGPLNMLIQNGWTKESVKAGDEVTVKGYPCGGANSNRGSATEVTLSGKKLLSKTHTP